MTAMNAGSATVATNAYTNTTSTTPSNLTSAPTTGIVATPYVLIVDGVLQNAATGDDVVTLFVETGVTTSAVLIEPGSYCALVN
jgi:hypothetical protein